MLHRLSHITRLLSLIFSVGPDFSRKRSARKHLAPSVHILGLETEKEILPQFRRTNKLQGHTKLFELDQSRKYAY